MAWEPAVGDVVTVTQHDSACVGDVGEIESVMHGAIAVRIVQEDSAWYHQLVHFNAGQLAPVTFGR